MELQSIISLANKTVELQFNVMVRSLRDVGCHLPVKVIPYNDDLFDLPPGCEWWIHPELNAWLEENNVTPRRRKFQSFLASNFQFADPDIVFLKDPAKVLAPHSGFIATDTEWARSSYTESMGTVDALKVLAAKSSVWQLRLFNSGQFACEDNLYTFDSLQAMASSADVRGTCLGPGKNDQLSMNVLVAKSQASVVNLTQPPHYMESTWAGDYPFGYEQYWRDPDTAPYLIHWAGMRYFADDPVNKLFENYLTQDELTVWNARKAKFLEAKEANASWPFLVRANAFLVRKLFPGFYVSNGKSMATEDQKSL